MNKSLGSFLLCLSSFLITVPAQAQELQGSALSGSKKNTLCVGCHGIKGFHTAFPETFQVPKLSGQGAQYILTALRAYKAGERKHPSMRAMSASLNEQDMADIAAYYESTGTGVTLQTKAPVGSVKAAELVTKAGCISCHGENFSKPISPTYPKIAGQNADYLFFALRSYKSSDKPLMGRSNPIMGGIAKQFSNAELKVLADYVGGLPSELQTLQLARIK
jgi:cytochrome c553